LTVIIVLGTAVAGLFLLLSTRQPARAAVVVPGGHTGMAASA
jgi:hypothetical protein